MSPRIEIEKTGEITPHALAFVVDLNNEDRLDMAGFRDLFDGVEEFDELTEEKRAKFIVTKNKLMYVFNPNITHYNFYEILKDHKLAAEPLLCAGEISAPHIPNLKPILGSSSLTLASRGVLSIGESNKYKLTVLREKLGNDFKIN